jgi:fumarylacetoacetate (FAA) hydrolase family protein
MEGRSNLAEISRDPEEIVANAINENHQYPDGLVVYLGTMFAPVADRGEAGKGFTHKPGDIVEITTPLLGRLRNTVVHCNVAAPWTFGVADLMKSLAKRKLL